MSDVVLKNKNGATNIYSGVNVVFLTDSNGDLVPYSTKSGDILPMVVLTTPMKEGLTFFTAEESEALSEAASTGLPVIVKCEIRGTPDVVFAMDNYAVSTLYSLYVNYHVGMVRVSFDEWLGEVVKVSKGDDLPSVTEADNGKVLKVVDGAWALGDDESGDGGGTGTALPTPTTDDNGKFLRVVDGAYALVALTDVSVEGA